MKYLIQKVKKFLDDAPLRLYSPKGTPTGFVIKVAYKAKRIGFLFPKYYVLEMTTETTDFVNRNGEEITGVTTYCTGYTLQSSLSEAEKIIDSIEDTLRMDELSHDAEMYH
ncbi:hypothetical protein [Vibrio owensii]|uniref:hypothetical protein n=1 Tax=Vibrio owensii TaxID=696485 RepID=UPI003CC611AA